MVEFYDKINAPYKRHTSGPNKGKFITGEWSLPEFGYLADCQWDFKEKIDGTNIIIHLERSQDWLYVNFYGRTERSVLPKPLAERLHELFPATKTKYDVQAREGLIGSWMIDNDLEEVVLYGEGIGEKIQGGPHGPDYDFVLFDVNIGGNWLSQENIEDVAHNLELCNVSQRIGVGTLWEGIEIVQNGFQSRANAEYPEGLIARPSIPLFTRDGKRITTKIKRVDFQK